MDCHCLLPRWEWQSHLVTSLVRKEFGYTSAAFQQAHSRDSVKLQKEDLLFFDAPLIILPQRLVILVGTAIHAF